MDYKGNLCGADSPVKDLKYKWDPNYNFITFNDNLELVPSELGICVDSCKKMKTSLYLYATAVNLCISFSQFRPPIR